ncbi:MAG TPA: urea carboxylase-associated family protein [Thermomicrobiaceae bacterium]|nr:urea carboxylase-associated family protein [Thermomicrobiaceae bacterium]
MTTSMRPDVDDQELRIPPAEARAFRARAGMCVTVIDLEGEQIGDFVALNAADHRERLSTCHTRSALRRIYVRQGDHLYSNLRRPMFEVVEDRVGRHDLTIAACDARLYAERHGLPDHPNCLDNLTGALAPFGIEQWLVPEPFNIFQNTTLDPDGNYRYAAPLSRPGDRLVLRALIDVVGAVSACAHDLSTVNGGKLTPLLLRVTAVPPA